MLDFSRFIKPYRAVVPVVNGAFVLNRKRFRVTAGDGFANVLIEGNHATYLAPGFFEQVPKNTVRGFVYNNYLVFENFDVARRKWGFEVQKPLLYNTAETFNSAIALVWEDRNIFYLQPNYEDLKSFAVKDAYEQEQTLSGMKNITPELRLLYLLHAVERAQVRARLEAMRAQIEAADRQRQEEALRSTFEGRLKYTFEMVGAELSNFTRSGPNVIVDWTLPGSDYRFNSVLDATTFRVVEAGYCLSNDDRRHVLSSMVLLAKDYEERDLLHITRRS